MKITIITETYNSEKTLRNTMESILSQTYKDIEYIIIDGNSKDHTLDIVKEYEPRFEGRMHWISEPDKGIYDALNKGIRRATGEVIGILHSDDFFTTEKIIEQVARGFEEYDTDAIYGDIHFVEDERLDRTVRYYSSKIFSRRLMRLGFIPAHPSFYAKKEVFEKFGLYRTDYRVAADFEFLLRTIYCGRISTHYLPVDMVTMRTGGASTSGLSSHRTIMKEHLRAFKENKLYANVCILSLRYFYKIYEVGMSKLKYR